MARTLPKICLLAALSAWSSAANAFCSYHGKMYAETTVDQEYADAHWVVRVKVIAADNHWSDEGDSWTIYQLQILSAFKGKPPARIKMFTYRDSGGFYLDKGMANDLGGEYLLFLDPVSRQDAAPDAAKGGTQVNYACGQSKSWSAVSESEQRELVRLAHR